MPFDDTPRKHRGSKRLDYRLMLACNDPDNGNEIGQISVIDICNLALESDDRIYSRPLTLVEMGDSIRISGKRWPITFSKYGVGNWCWNAYGMKAETVVDFLFWLRRRKLFKSWSGCTDLCEFMNGAEKTPFEVRALLDAWLIREN